jgi:hypothetical protein
MMCYKDRTYCDAPCKHQGTCRRSEAFAMAEKQASPDPFIRGTMPLATADFSGQCDDFFHALVIE